MWYTVVRRLRRRAIGATAERSLQRISKRTCIPIDYGLLPYRYYYYYVDEVGTYRRTEDAHSYVATSVAVPRKCERLEKS